MDGAFEDRQRYLEASRRVREIFARHQLDNVLSWAFSADEIADLPEDELEDFLDRARDGVCVVEPAWEAAMDDLRGVPVAMLLGDLSKAFAKIRAIAQDIATGERTAMSRVAVSLYVPARAGDRDGRPRWMMQGGLREALVWTALRLFSEVPRSLIRTCLHAGCPRVYVGIKNQKHCLDHQADARRQAQRNAEKAFRDRERAKKTTTKRRKTS